MIPNVQLYSDSSRVSDTDLKNWANALQIYTDHYLAYYWHNHARVSAVPKGQAPSAHAWYIKISDSIDEPGAAGVHLDNNNQPYALVEVQDNDTTSIVVSHEYAEMLADPWGNRLTPPTPQIDNTTMKFVRYLVELCDPCEDDQYARKVNGVKLSDFITHNYFFGVPHGQPGLLSAFNNITSPREVLTNGYISWLASDGNWYQYTNFEGQGPQTVNLGQMPAGAKSIREWINSKTKDSS